MKTLYFDCASGISGDMAVAALLDAGGGREGLLGLLSALPLQNFSVNVSETAKHGIRALSFSVSAEKEHIHRHPADIRAIIDASPLTPGAKELAEKILAIIAGAEAAVHGISEEKVHFHEVGAVDSIVDIIAAAHLLDELSPDKVFISPLTEGAGFIDCQHGRLPVPAPAVLEIAKRANIPLRLTDIQGEMVTPTGIAILAALEPECATLLLTHITNEGIGAGQKDFPHANLLRAVIMDEPADVVTELTASIDDNTPEQLGRLMALLLDAGALDVYYAPILMKKNRPASLLTVLCKATEKDALIRLIFRHSATAGVRFQTVPRRVMNRSFSSVDTPFGAVTVKRLTYEDIVKESVEYESARAAAERFDVTLDEVVRKTLRFFSNK